VVVAVAFAIGGNMCKLWHVFSLIALEAAQKAPAEIAREPGPS
jgi:hypothetical protein